MTSGDAVEIQGQSGGRWLITCEHASNHVPDWISGGDLGLCREDMGRHIAFDVGAEGVSRTLADLLGGQAILGRFSRLVIDPNRGEDDPTLIMQLNDGSVIPGNRGINGHERQERLDRLYRPYHRAVSETIARAPAPLIVAVHSFTPNFKGRTPRPWHIGLLSAQDRRLADPMLDLLGQDPDLLVGDNEPYAGHLKGDAMERHGIRTGHPHILIEIRNDLIETHEQQQGWATRLAPVLTKAAEIAGL